MGCRVVMCSKVVSTFIVYSCSTYLHVKCILSVIAVKCTDCVMCTEQEASKKSSVAWLKTVLRSGTTADKTAALVLMIQEAPIHNLSSLDTLLAMVKKKGGRREVLQTLGEHSTSHHVS